METLDHTTLVPGAVTRLNTDMEPRWEPSASLAKI